MHPDGRRSQARTFHLLAMTSSISEADSEDHKNTDKHVEIAGNGRGTLTATWHVKTCLKQQAVLLATGMHAKHQNSAHVKPENRMFAARFASPSPAVRQSGQSPSIEDPSPEPGLVNGLTGLIWPNRPSWMETLEPNAKR